MPIYYVVCVYVHNPRGYAIYQILETIETVVEEVDAGRIDLQKFYAAGHTNLQAYMFAREPANPFRKEVEQAASTR